MDEESTMLHLGNVLYMLADLHPDDRCDAFDQALEYYNTNNINCRVMPSGIGDTRLVNHIKGLD